MEEALPDIRQIRAVYIACFGRDAWSRAVSLAGRHRARAAKHYGLTEHWTPQEWLDLCAQTGFRCSTCDSETCLEPHHRISMVFGGSNTIDNIVPICRDCHRPLFGGEADKYWEREGPRLQLEWNEEWEREQRRQREEWAEAWFLRQKSLLAEFARGDAVWRHCGVDASVPGVIVRVVPPERGEAPKPLESSTAPSRQREAKALVYWPTAGGTVLTPSRVIEAIPLEEIARADVTAWVARHQEEYLPRRVGETVRLSWGRKTAYGVVLSVQPPSLGGPWEFGEDRGSSGRTVGVRGGRLGVRDRRLLAALVRHRGACALGQWEGQD